MTSHRCQHNLIFSTIKKEHLCHYLFLFSPKKSAADAHRIICEAYDKNVIAIRTCTNWFKTI